MAIGVEVGVLQRVLRLGVVAQRGAGDAEELAVVAPHQGGERGVVAAGDELGERGVVAGGVRRGEGVGGHGRWREVRHPLDAGPRANVPTPP